jgi:integrase
MTFLADGSDKLRGIENRSGIRHLTPHDLRRTFASWLHAKGAGARVIQELLGHSSILTTEKYITTTPQQHRTAVGNLPDVLPASRYDGNHP